MTHGTFLTLDADFDAEVDAAIAVDRVRYEAMDEPALAGGLPDR